MSAQQEVRLSVLVTYSGELRDEDEIANLVKNALEYSRQEGMLSDPEWEDTSCDQITCRIADPDEDMQ